jgi:hypothetical protein
LINNDGGDCARSGHSCKGQDALYGLLPLLQMVMEMVMLVLVW